MIPPKIHTIWLGPMRDDVQKLADSMQITNLKWSFRLWGDEILARYRKDPYVQRLQQEGEQAAHIVDRLRLLLLRDEGGWWMDADCQAIRPVADIPGINLPHWDFVFGLRNPHRPQVALHRGIPLVDNTVMASAQNGRMVNRLLDLYKPQNKQWLQTGASIGREILRSCDHTTMALNYRYFYSDEVTDETIVLHDSINLGSWTKAHQMPTLVAV